MSEHQLHPFQPQVLDADVETAEESTLAQRLDPALNEVTSGMGALFSDLVGQTLRGGVERIDEELRAQVDAKVKDSVAHRLPQIESAADAAARQAAERLSGRFSTDLDQAKKNLAEEIFVSGQQTEKAARDMIHEQVSRLTRRSKTTLESLNNRLATLRDRADSLEYFVQQLQAQNEQLNARLTQLEQGRGVKSLWRRLFKPRRRASLLQRFRRGG